MTSYQKGMIDKLAELSELFGFNEDKKKNSKVPGIAGGTVGGIAGLAGAKKIMRSSPGAQKELMKAYPQLGRILRVYGKRLIPMALVGTALGAIAANKMEDQ